MHVDTNERLTRPESHGRMLSDILADVYASVRGSKPIVEAIPCGWGLLDETTGGLVRGGYTGLIAAPGSGKTTLADRLVVDALLANPEARAIIFALETAPAVRVARLVAGAAVEFNEAGGLIKCLPVGALLRGHLDADAQAYALERIEHFHRSMNDHLRFIDDLTSAGDIARVIEVERPDIVAIDHLGLVGVEGFGDSEIARQDAALGRLTAALRTSNAAGLIINETSKAALKENRIDLTASRGSARFASLASVFIGLRKQRRKGTDGRDPEVVALLGKSRFGSADKQQRSVFFGGLSYFSWGPVEDVAEETPNAGA